MCHTLLIILKIKKIRKCHFHIFLISAFLVLHAVSPWRPNIPLKLKFWDLHQTSSQTCACLEILPLSHGKWLHRSCARPFSKHCIFPIDLETEMEAFSNLYSLETVFVLFRFREMQIPYFHANGQPKSNTSFVFSWKMSRKRGLRSLIYEWITMIIMWPFSMIAWNQCQCGQ